MISKDNGLHEVIRPMGYMGSSLLKGAGKLAYLQNIKPELFKEDSATFLDILPEKAQKPFDITSDYLETKLKIEGSLLKDPDVHLFSIIAGGVLLLK